MIMHPDVDGCPKTRHHRKTLRKFANDAKNIKKQKNTPELC